MTKRLLTESDLYPSAFIGKQGNGIISFGSGQPDLPPPKEVFESIKNYDKFKYGLIQGNEELREKLSTLYPYSTPQNFVVTNGASEALDLTLRAISRNGNKKKKNKVLMLKPYYYSYAPLVEIAGMQPIFSESNKGKFDLEDLESKISDCKAVLVNSPSNPTGRVEDIETLKRLEKITGEKETYVLSDEVYKDLIYERENYLIKGPHVVTINSFSKTYSMCGHRVGYLWSLDKKLVDDIIEMKSHTSMNTNIIAQEMAKVALNTPKEYVDNQLQIWKSRRNLIYEKMTNLGLDVWKPEGAFYVLPKIPNPKKFVLDMYNEHDIITYLGEWFGAPDRVRFSYALDKEKIEEGIMRVEKYLKS